MMKNLPINLFFYAHGSAYFSTMPAYYFKRVVCSFLKTAYSGKLRRKLLMAEAENFSLVQRLGTLILIALYDRFLIRHVWSDHVVTIIQ